MDLDLLSHLLDQARSLVQQQTMPLGGTCGPTIRELAERVLAERYQPGLAAPATIRVASIHWTRIVADVGDLRVDQVSPEALAVLRQHPQARRDFLSAGLRWAARWGWHVPCDPFAGAPRSRKPKRKVGARPEAVRAVLAAADRMFDGGRTSWQARALVRLLVLTGCRRSELQSLRWRSVDLEAGCIQLERSKVGPRPVPVSPAACDLLRRLPSVGGEWVFPSPQRAGAPYLRAEVAWRAIAVEAGCKGLRMHDLRHGYARIAVEAGVPVEWIRVALGHSNSQQTLHYCGHNDDHGQRCAVAVARWIEGAA